MLNFSFELMESSKASLERIENCVNNIKFILKNKGIDVASGTKLDNIDDFNELVVDMKTDSELVNGELEAFEKICEFIKEFFDKMDDDLNTADAETQIYEIVRVINQTVNENNSIAFLNSALLIVDTLLGILGIDLNNKTTAENDVDETLIEKMIAERTEAKKAKDFVKADEIRKNLLDMGIELEDTRQGVKWKKV